MAGKDTTDDDADRAEVRKKLATFSTAQRDLIGSAIIESLINPEVVFSTGSNGNYRQDGGAYTQSGGGNHIQGGNGGYTQTARADNKLGVNTGDLLTVLLDVVKNRGG